MEKSKTNKNKSILSIKRPKVKGLFWFVFMYESQRNTKSNLRLNNISNHQTLDEVIKEPFGDDVVEYIFYHISIYPLSSG